MHRTITATFVLCLLSLCISPICQAFEITDCGSKVGKFTSVTLSGCDMTKAACDLIRNTNATIHIEFTLDKDVKEVHAVVRGIIMDIPIPFPLPNADACKYSESGLACPLVKDQTYHYMNTLPVLKSYPMLSVIVKWELRDENNEDIVCMLIPAKIK